MYLAGVSDSVAGRGWTEWTGEMRGLLETLALGLAQAIAEALKSREG